MVLHNGDTMTSDLMTLQAAFMTVLGIDDKAFLAHQDWKYLDSAIKGLCSEAGEVLQETNFLTRTWDTTEFNKRVNSIVFESLDVYFYLLEVFILLGLSPEEIAAKYQTKLIYNLARVLKKIPNVADDWKSWKLHDGTPIRAKAAAAFELLESLGVTPPVTNFAEWLDKQTAPER